MNLLQLVFDWEIDNSINQIKDTDILFKLFCNVLFNKKFITHWNLLNFYP